MNAVLQIALADFRERVRRFSLLVIAALAVLLAYQVISGFFQLRLGSYQGLLNAAWIGALMSLTLSFFLSLAGFYIVRGNVEQDRHTGVGQILAATPLTKLAYVVGKFASNAGVLMLVTAVLALAALAMLLIHGEEKNLDLFQLWMPFLVFSLPVALVTAALAVLFECAPGLRGQAGNVVYFFLWLFLVTPISGDLLAFQAIQQGMTVALQSQGADYSGGIVLGAGGAVGLKTFLWTGFDWPPVAAARLVYLAAAAALVGLAALVFERFEAGTARRPSSPMLRLRLTGWLKPLLPRSAPVHVSPDLSARRLSPVSLAPNILASFVTLVIAELKILLKGRSFLWATAAIGLIAACLLSPLETARLLLPVAWLWPLLLWSEMGVRARRHQVQPLLHAAPFPLRLQLPAAWAAGVLLALILGSGVLVRFVSEPPLLPGFFAGALFFPALALFLGTATGTERPYQILALVCWYLGPLNGLAVFDVTAANDSTLAQAVPYLYLAAAPLLVGLSLLIQQVKLEKNP